MSMMENLPKGLVAKSARIPSRLEAPSHVDAGDIARLWKGLYSIPMSFFSLYPSCTLANYQTQSTTRAPLSTRTTLVIDWRISSGESGETSSC